MLDTVLVDAAVEAGAELRERSSVVEVLMDGDWATLAPPPPEMEAVFNAMRYDQTATDRFMGTLAGTVPIAEFYAPENLERIAGALDA